MRGLLGDRFLRKFAGDLKYRRKYPDSTGEGQSPEAEVDAAPGPEAVGPDVNTSEEHREETAANAADAGAAVADTNDVPIKAEPNQQNGIGQDAD